MTRLMAGSWGSVLVMSVVLLAGCSSAGSSEQPVEDVLTGADLSGVSDAQAAEIDDRVVTADEYQAAFQRHRECLSAAGFELEDVKFTGLVYEARISNEAMESGAYEKCYALEYRYTDMMWQGTDAVQDGSDTAELVRGCLHKRGIEPGGTLKEMQEQLSEAGIEIPECLS